MKILSPITMAAYPETDKSRDLKVRWSKKGENKEKEDLTEDREQERKKARTKSNCKGQTQS